MVCKVFSRGGGILMKKLCSMCKRKAVDYTEQYCADCKPKTEALYRNRLRDMEANKAYRKTANKNRALKNKDSLEQAFYCSKAWKSLRLFIIGRCKGLCIYCLMVKNTMSEGKDVHHIETLKDDWSKRLDVNNLVCLCRDCHLYAHEQYTLSNLAKEKMQEKLREILKEFTDKYKISLDYYCEEEDSEE